MSTALEKLKGDKAATPHEIMETDKDNINLSRDQFESKYRKKKEISAKLAAEKARLELEADEEIKALENIGLEDIKKEVKEEE